MEGSLESRSGLRIRRRNGLQEGDRKEDGQEGKGVNGTGSGLASLAGCAGEPKCSQSSSGSKRIPFQAHPPPSPPSQALQRGAPAPEDLLGVLPTARCDRNRSQRCTVYS